MGRFLLTRLFHGVIVVAGVSIIVFVVTRLIGDPVNIMLPVDATDAQRADLRASLGFDQPIWRQFLDFVGGVMRFDFGDSLWQRRPVTTVILEHVPNTLLLVSTSMIVAVVLALIWGIIAALRPGTWLDRAMVSLSLIGLSIAQFWLGLMLIIVFAVKLQWLPSSGVGGMSHLILPALTLALPSTGRIAMMVRSSMIGELNSQYAKTARAKGMPFRRVVFLHSLRNAALPVVTVSGWELARALAGYAVIVETVFAFPGVGYLALQAITNQDLVLLQGVVFVVALIVVLVNIAVDITYRMIDPRVTVS